MTSELDLLRTYAANPEEEEFGRGLLLDYYLEHDPERAEFLKLHTKIQELDKAGHGDQCDRFYTRIRKGLGPGGQMTPKCDECENLQFYAHLAGDLLFKNRDRWLRVRCPECIAGRVVDVSTGTRTGCKACMSTGDLCRFTHPGTASQDHFDVEWKNGFPHKVTGAKHTDVFEQRTDRAETKCGGCNGKGGEYKYPSDDPLNKRLHGSHWYGCSVCYGAGRLVLPSTNWRPTEVAVAWLTHHPTIREIEIGNIGGVPRLGGPPVLHRITDAIEDDQGTEVSCVFDLMKTEVYTTVNRIPVTREWDRQDHNRAVADWVRSFVK